MQVNLPPEPVLLQGDPEYLERLVLNLVSNAVKFTPAGGAVEVVLHLRGDVAELCVTDNGMGIPLEEQGRLFQRFFRSTLATEHAIQGTGLGLHIVRSIAEAHSGSVDVESTLGIGSTFRFVVPLAPSVVQDERPEAGPATELAQRVEEPIIEAARRVEEQARQPAHRAGQRETDQVT
jgi:signal transduction histidine kinase